MKVLFVASEAAPFIKTGGLADVVGTLPVALAKAGVSVRVIIPKYRLIAQEYKEAMRHVCHFTVKLGWREQYCGIETLMYEGVRFYFVDNEYYFGRDLVYGNTDIDECERFCFFNRAVIEAISRINYRPDIIHANDWQSGMIPMLLNTQYRHIPDYADIRTVFTIHNLRYQGLFPWEWVNDLLSIDAKYYSPQYLEFYNCLSFLKAGLVFSDRVTTVSPTYAHEITTAFYGERLDGVLREVQMHGRLSGILNGIDNNVYNPETDTSIRAGFSVDSLDNKALCKEALQEEMLLDKRPDVPLITMVTRFADHKGLELVEHVIDDILRMDVQFAVLGTGSERYVNLFRSIAARNVGRASVKVELNDALARRMYAGGDIFLMPSLFEPCGIAQLIAMRYGTIPVVRETGGLRDSVEPYNKFTNEGTGFSFSNYNAHEMLFTLERAVDYFHNKDVWNALVKRAMQKDFGWASSAKLYMKLYRDVTRNG